MTPDWDPNSLEPKPSPQSTGGPAIDPLLAPFLPQPSLPSPSTTQSRVGPILFTVGVGLIGLNFLLNSFAYYEVLSAPLNNNSQWLGLLLGFGELFSGIGVLIASTGWVLDKRAGANAPGISQADRGARRIAGQAIVLLGAAVVAGATVFLGVVELEAYYQVTFSLPNWTLPFIYAAEGVGVLGIAVGWAIHRSTLNAG